MKLSHLYHAVQRSVERSIDLPRRLEHGQFKVLDRRPGRKVGEYRLTVVLNSDPDIVLVLSTDSCNSAEVITCYRQVA